MKRFFIYSIAAVCLLSSSPSLQADEVLMKVAGKPVMLSEFEYIYNKNNSNNSIDKKSLEEYMTLFKNFRLKVTEAESLGLDTTKAFIQELDGYRKQLAQPYLTDNKVDDALVREAYDRLKEDVEVSHILVRADGSNPKNALDKANALLEQIKKGVDFAQLAKENSEDPGSGAQGGYLGFITGFYTVYPFETAAYQTPVGTVSEPIQTRFGYHLVKVHSRRPSKGEVLVAHIMKMVPKDAADSLQVKAEKEILDIAAQLKTGGDFAALAKTLSDDKQSGARGGELSWFGTGRMVKEFEDAAFSLKEKGEICAPIKSPYGWHIIKLIDTKGLEPFEAKQADLARRIKKDERASKGQDALIETLKQEYKYTVIPEALQAFINKATATNGVDSLFYRQIQTLEAPLCKIADKTITQAEFSQYIKSNKVKASQAATEEAFDKFSHAQILSYEDKQLENKYVDFRNLIKEYRDGILLFEVSNREVWEKASKDTEGLQSFFAKNKANYSWKEPRYKGILLQCKDKATLAAARSIIKKSSADSVLYKVRKALNNDSVTAVKIEKGLYQKGDNPAIDKYAFKDKKSAFTPTESLPVVAVVGKMLKKGPEVYTDQRGIVTADYQNYLEEQWIKALQSKYPVEVDQRVVAKVKQN